MRIARPDACRAGLPVGSGNNRLSRGRGANTPGLAHLAVPPSREGLISSTDLMLYATRATGIGGPVTTSGKRCATDTPGPDVTAGYASPGAFVSTRKDPI